MTWPTKTDFVDGDVLNASQMNNIGSNLNLANPTGVAAGRVLTADGANSMSFQPISAESMTLIASGSFSSSNFALGSTWSGYKQLRLICDNASYTAGSVFGFRVNGISTTSYQYWYIMPTAATAIVNNINSSNYGLAAYNSAAQFDSSVLDIYNCDVTNSPKLYVAYTGKNDTSYQRQSFMIGTISVSAAITSMSMVNPFGTSSATYRLFGIK